MDKDKIYKIQEKIEKDFFENRKLFLWGGVDEKLAYSITTKIMYLNTISTKDPIFLFINSPGGSVTCGMAIIDVIKVSQAPCITICMGLAASMGALIFSVGTKKNRYVLPNAKIMIHQPLISGQIIAPALDIKIHADEIKKTKFTINTILSNVTGKSVKEIEKNTDRDYYLNANESIKYGIADQVISDINKIKYTV